VKLKNGLAFRLTAYIICSIVLVFGIIVWYNYNVSKKLFLKDMKENASNLAGSTIHKIETVLLSSQKIPENIATVIEQSHYSDKELKTFLKLAVERNDEIYGSTIAFEPRAFEQDSFYYAPYYCKSGDSTLYSNLGALSYNYLKWGWYTIPKAEDHPVWTEPYIDVGGGNVLMTTYSVPFYRYDTIPRKFKGIVTIDISLEWLQKLISEIKIYETGYAFLISEKGTFITHPNKDYVLKENIIGIAEKHNHTQLKAIGQNMLAGKTGFDLYYGSIYTKKKCRLYYTPLKSCNWSMGLVIPEDELLADLRQLTKQILFMGIIGFIIIALIIIFISKTITRPLTILAKATRETGTGRFDVPLPVINSKNEIGQLTKSFRLMQDQLKTYIRNLQETTAAKEKIESELKIASAIQMGMIPKEFPAFPKNNEFNIYGIMHPAKEVGGDLYNYFFVDKEHLCFTIGDVSGKGIPAALFMAMTNTLIKAMALNGKDPATILIDTNKELCRENEQMMFVTLFMGILNINTGEVLFANAGHNPPMILRKNEPPKFMKLDSGIALGISEEAVYETEKLQLNTSDAIFIYTDGVTEATNKGYVLYSENRLLFLMEKISEQNLNDMVSSTLDDIHLFIDGAMQSDDITMLALRFN
jgi:phosphoserine phosphatase RsbU/P